jgi:hypothetical protein
MDDSKLDKGPVKVRCAKCKEVFVVQKAGEPEESFQVPTDVVATPSAVAPSVEEETTSRFAQAGTGFGFEGGTTDDGSFSFNMDTPAESVPSSAVASPPVPADASDEFDWKDSTPFGETESSGEFDLQGFSTASATESPAATSAPTDTLGEFDFGDIPQSEPAPPVQSSGGDSSSSGDFSIDFGEVSFSNEPAAEAAAPAPFEFSFATNTEESSPAPAEESPGTFAGSGGDFELSFDADATATDDRSAVDNMGAGSTAFGDFDFGEVEEPARAPSQQVSAQYVAPPPVIPEDQATAGTGDFPEPPLQDELPPASLTTRKKRGSLFPVFVIIGAILLVVALAGSGVYFFGGPKVFSKVGLGFLVEWYGKTSGEEGEITLRNIKAEYLASKEAGELFVVRGEAVNNYKKPRASVQIKVSLLGSGGAPLKTKTAFCGNSLSNEQVVTLPLAKVEEVMNNQFGDSLANLGVKPGNAIPFVVVVSGVPKEASDFSVQVSGSTVATQ